jgi:hypothetical protein
MAVMWVFAACSPVKFYRRFRGKPTSYRHHHPDDGGNKYLRNIGKLLPDYIV